MVRCKDICDVLSIVKSLKDAISSLDYEDEKGR